MSTEIFRFLTVRPPQQTDTAAASTNSLAFLRSDPRFAEIKRKMGMGSS